MGKVKSKKDVVIDFIRSNKHQGMTWKAVADVCGTSTSTVASARKEVELLELREEVAKLKALISGNTAPTNNENDIVKEIVDDITESDEFEELCYTLMDFNADNVGSVFELSKISTKKPFIKIMKQMISELKEVIVRLGLECEQWYRKYNTSGGNVSMDKTLRNKFAKLLHPDNYPEGIKQNLATELMSYVNGLVS